VAVLLLLLKSRVLLVLPLAPLASSKLSKRQRKANKALLVLTDNTLKLRTANQWRIQTHTAVLVTCTHTRSLTVTLLKSLVLVRRSKPLKADKDLLDAICLCFISQTT
jgi:hypothetical protein